MKPLHLVPITKPAWGFVLYQLSYTRPETEGVTGVEPATRKVIAVAGLVIG